MYENEERRKTFMEIHFGGKSMGPTQIVLGIALLVVAVALAVAVLMQSGKDSRLSGAIAGGADTFFSKSKASTMDRILSKVTVVIAIIFMILVVVMYVVC